MRGERRTWCAGPLAPDFGPVMPVDFNRLLAQQRAFLGGEGLGKEQITFLVEVANLLFCEHGLSPLRSDHGRTLPGFIMPRGSIAFLISRMSASSAPPRQSGIM